MKDFLGETGDESVNEGLASYIVIDNGGQECFLLVGLVMSSLCNVIYNPIEWSKDGAFQPLRN